MVRLVEKLYPKKDDVVQWHSQDGNITTNIKVKLDFTLPALIATNSVMWNFHLYDSAKVRYDMILGRYKITELGLNLKIPNTSSNQMVDPLKSLQNPLFIWVHIYLKI